MSRFEAPPPFTTYRCLLAMILLSVVAMLAPAMISAQSTSEAPSVRFALPEANNSGLEARIKLIDLGGGQTRIVIALRGNAAGDYLPHIHTGRCESYPGDPTWPLALFSAGERSRTTVDVSYDQVLSGDFLVDIHPVSMTVDDLFDPATALVCGQLDAEQQTPDPTPTPRPEIEVIRGPNTGVGPIPDQYWSTILVSILAVVTVVVACAGVDLRRRATLSIAQCRLNRLTGRQL